MYGQHASYRPEHQVMITTAQKPLKCVGTHFVQKNDRTASKESISACRNCRSIQWTADGTSLVSLLSNNDIQTIVVPADLLDGRVEPHQLRVYCSIPSSEPVRAIAIYPRFDLQDPATTLLLSAANDLPIRLSSAPTGDKLASYPLINPMTEEYISPNALCFSSDGSRFIAGSESLISVFDVLRSGQEPLLSCPTGPKRRAAGDFNASTHVRGIISALDLEHASNILAAGTFSRHVALYDAGGQGECIGAFTVAGNEADKVIGGQGVTQVVWSPCGRYLYIAERMSTGSMVYDIRKTGQLLSWLQNRQALTNQRLGIDVCQGEGGGQEVWAGGTDGILRRWKDAQLHEGSVQSNMEASIHSGEVTRIFLGLR